MNDPIPMQTPDPLYAPMHAMLHAAQELLLAAAREYQVQLPQDAQAWGALLVAGKVTPAVRIELPPEGARLKCGYLAQDGVFHPFFEVPDPRLAPGKSNLN
ncbi:MAG: hypothetical protein A3G81_26000 [Betaproteobacteria bacterium RIFCSPLOWO2_12_FULL_65_14]|nr:MAG: hypothetical protein A3G81_26000 [Betaproteobacteria bacterium RIFCSPLOWO2_12_FULL_65_14]